MKRPVLEAVVKAYIEDALRRSAETDATHISVQVLGASIMLTGHVSSAAEKREAERAAWSSPGVSAVSNKLEVRV